MNSTPSPYSPPKQSSTGTSTKKRSYSMLRQSSSTVQTHGYLIPLPSKRNPMTEFVLNFPQPRTEERSKQHVKSTHGRVKPTHIRLPSMESNNGNNNKPGTPEANVQTQPSTTIGSSYPLLSSIPLDLYYTTEFRTTLSAKVNLSGWGVQDADLVTLAALHKSSPPTQQLQHIYLNECTSFTDNGLKALGSIPSLRTLHCKLCPQLHGEAMFGFSHLINDLNLSGSIWVHDTIFSYIVRSFVRLQSLSVANCTLITNQGLFALAERPHQYTPLLELDISGCIKITDTGLLVVLAQCQKLEHLQASTLPFIEGITLYATLSQQRLLPSALTHLNLSNNKSLHFSALPTLAKGCGRKLSYLNLTNASGINDDGLIALGKYCPALHSLHLHGCSSISDAGITRLVQHVAVSNENDIEYDPIHTTRCTQLRMLDLISCFHITTESILVVANECVGLTHIYLHGLPRVDSRAHEELAKRCRHMVEVGMNGILVQSAEKNFFAAPKLSQRSLKALLVESTATSLHVNKAICDADELAQELKAIPQTKQMRDLQFGSLVTDAVCVALEMCASHIRTLNLSRSRQFHTASLVSLLKLTQQLRTLDIQHCDQLTDDVPLHLPSHCPLLEHLNIAGNTCLTDNGMVALIPSNACRRLMALNAKSCRNISKQVLARIAASHPLSQLCSNGLEPKPYEMGSFVARSRLVQQAACKVVAWLQLCLKRHRENELRRRLMWTRLKFRHQCARRIQRVIREVQSAKREVERLAQEARELHERQDWAARTLQRYLRVYLMMLQIHRQVAAKRAADAFDEAVRKRNEEYAAASCIQQAYRYYLGRVVTLAWHQRLGEYLVCRTHRATQIQCLFRGVRGRHVSATLRRSEQEGIINYILQEHTKMVASVYLTRLVRGFLGRRIASKRLKHAQEVQRMRHEQARIIQRAFRAYYASIALARHIFNNATKIQRIVRGWMERYQTRRYIVAEKYVTPIVLCLLAPRSIFQLDLAQSWQYKRNAGIRFATAIQSAWRGYLGRVKANIYLSQRLHQKYTQDVAARRLQRFFAKVREMKHLERVRVYVALRNACSTKIQSIWRMWLGKVRSYAVYLGQQRRLKHHVIRSLYYQALYNPSSSSWKHWRLAQEGAAYTLVHFYRNSLHARGWMSPSYISHRNQRATHIQAWIRGFLMRRSIRQYAAQLHKAAHLLQRTWHRKVEWMKWRQLIESIHEKKRHQLEEDRASGISKTRMKQYANEMLERQCKSIIVLQRMYRTLKQRHVFKNQMDQQISQWKQEGGEKLNEFMRIGCNNPIFRAQVWLDTMAKPLKPSQELYLDADVSIGYNEIVAKTTELMPLNLDEEIEILKNELNELENNCHQEFIFYEKYIKEEIEINKNINYYKKILNSKKIKNKNILKILNPFLIQSKNLILKKKIILNENQFLKNQLIYYYNIKKNVFNYSNLKLNYDPLLYSLDIQNILELFK